MIPQLRQVISERQQRRTFVVVQRARLFVLQVPGLLLESRDRRQAVIPSAFEFAGYQPVVGINGVILPARMCLFVACLLQCQFTLPQPIRTSPLAIGDQLQRRVNRRGEIASSTSADTAASMRILLKATHFLSEA